MREVDTVASLREILQQVRRADQSIGFVPTMGFLHAGHLRLVEEARKESALVIMSIFVNPTQFGPNEDFERYPRDLDRDRRLAAESGVGLLYIPDANLMYPEGPEEQMIWVDPGHLADHLCGASRPGHFRGVTTVVAKLLNMVQPDRLYLGQKDGQQAVILTRMARDLAFPVAVRVIPTVREEDGLALSSRNVYLSPEERRQAASLSQALSLAESAITAGERDVSRLEGVMRDLIEQRAPLGRIDYATIVDLRTLQPLQGTLRRDALIALAVYFGSTRLIDNMMLRFAGDVPHLT